MASFLTPPDSSILCSLDTVGWHPGVVVPLSEDSGTEMSDEPSGGISGHTSASEERDSIIREGRSDDDDKCTSPVDSPISRAAEIKHNEKKTEDHKSRILQEVDRLTRAIKQSLDRIPQSPFASDGTDEEEASSDGSKDKHFITICFNAGKFFAIPWAIGSTWESMEIFMRLYFSGEESYLKEVENGEYDLILPDVGRIVPATWEQMVRPYFRINIVFISFTTLEMKTPPAGIPPPPPPPPPPPSEPNEPEEIVVETTYENRIGYTVRYYEGFGPRRKFLGEITYDASVEFETSTDDAKSRPVLEEQKIVDRSSRPRKTFDKYDRSKKAKLGQFDRVTLTQVQIHSPYLLNVLRSIVVFSEESFGSPDSCLSNGIFPYPYKALYHHMTQLEAYRSGETSIRTNHSDDFNRQCDEHIDILLNYLRTQPSIPLQQLELAWSRETPVTTFQGLWLLLTPGSDVYVREADGSVRSAYVLGNLGGGSDGDSVDRIMTRYRATLWNMSFNGKVISRRPRYVDLPIFDNEREIIALPVFPVRFLDAIDNGTRRAKMIERGKSYFQYCKAPSFLEYSGTGLKSGRRNYNCARVVVEHASRPWNDPDLVSLKDWKLDENEGSMRLAIGLNPRVPRCRCKECATSHQQEAFARKRYDDYDDIDPKANFELSWHQYFLMSSYMFGFILKDRKYDLLDVCGLKDVHISERAIDTLEMDEKSKATIKAIAKTYTDNDGHTGRFSADFIQGKGEGQIILLHGPPGTGKTLTAESVADYTTRPLLSITAADLGHEPEKLEVNLLRFIRDAHDWDAIVLLDEADIYLERRSISDLKRNSIVSIFLRVLDYFQGLLFLTTNRVGQFDEAFLARIHVSIGYKPLDDEARGRIWDNLFRKLKEDRMNGSPKIDYDYDAKLYVKRSPEVIQLKWNGRAIRNAFQTAVALAVYDSKLAKGKSSINVAVIPVVKEAHLEQVVSMSSAFTKYITSTYEDIEDSDLAYKYGNRNDKFQDANPRTDVGSSTQPVADRSGSVRYASFRGR